MGAILKILFGWREVFVSADDQRYYRAKALLADNNIKNVTEINNPTMKSGSGVFVRPNYRMNTYYIYVKEKDLEKAKHVLRR